MESPKLPLPPYQIAPQDSPPPTSPIPTSTPPSRKKPTISPSPLHLSHYVAASIPLHDLLSPSKRKPKSSRGLIHDEAHEPVVNLTPRKKRRGRAASMVAAAASGFPGGCVASPRVGRRARRRLEKEVAVVREEREKELANGEEEGGVKGRRKRQCKAKKASQVVESKEDLSLVPFVPPAKDTQNVQEPGASNEGEDSDLGLCDRIYELIMWKDVAKSTLWFGLGSIFFLSSSFSRDFNFSLLSSFCHLGVFILGMAFLRDSIPQRPQLNPPSTRFQFTEEDILSVSRILLPIANEAISKAQLFFSGDPSTTIKVLPILLFGAKYGHLITFWRLSAAGFFFSFTLPRLYYTYSQKINRGVENVRNQAVQTWRNCPRKKFVAASVGTMFWNLFSVKTRIIAAFVSVVILRYHHQQTRGEEGHNEGIEIKEDETHEMVTE